MSGEVELIQHKGGRLALIIRDARTEDRVQFFSEKGDALQVGAFSMKRGYEIEPHIHKDFARHLVQTTEVLVMQTGRMKVDFYTADRRHLTSREVGAGDVIVLFEGGHGFTALDDVRMLEIKQGPYAGNQDKDRFECPSQPAA